MDADITETTTRGKSKTYLPDTQSRIEIVDFVKFFKDIDQFRGARTKPALKAADGTERELPQELYDVLEQVANALANGNGVTVAPYGMQLTTQEAADYLGISRPTLVKLLVAGDISYEMRGRHRRVTLRDLVDYQENSRVQRRKTLREMAQDGQRADMPTSLPNALRRVDDGD